MRISLIGLILLFLPAVKIKDACKTRNRQQTTHRDHADYEDVEYGPTDNEDRPLLADYHEQLGGLDPGQDDVANSGVTHPAPHFDLLIIGLGVQGEKCMVKFSECEYQHDEKFRIGVVETKSKLGPGLPYDEDVVFPEHLENFGEAVEEKPYVEKYFERPPATQKFVDAYERVMLTHPPPRFAEGRHFIHEFNESVKKCENIGYKIERMPLTTAVNIRRLRSGGYTVTLTGHHAGEVTTTDIFLSTGHWHRGRLGPEVDGYFESPWPASRLNDTVEAVHVGIGGSGMSADDAVLTLAHKFGTFEYDYEKKCFRYTVQPEYQGKFKMTMYSRSGHLSPVAGVRLALRDFPQHKLILHAIDVNKNGTGSMRFLPLDDVMQYFKDDLAALIPKLAENRDHFFQMGPKELIDHIDFHAYGQKDARQRLVDDIKAAKRSVNENTPMTLETFFFYAEKAFRVFLEHFSAEDTLTFKKYLAPAIAKWFAPIQPHNAEKLLALMNAGCLFLKAVGDNSHLIPGSETNQGVRVLYKGNYIYHRYFIDALAQSGDISKDPSPLTQNLTANGLIEALHSLQRHAKGESRPRKAQGGISGQRLDQGGRRWFSSSQNGRNCDQLEDHARHSGRREIRKRNTEGI